MNSLAKSHRRKIQVEKALRHKVLAALPEELSVLESLTVGPAGARDYRQRYNTFQEWADQATTKIDWKDAEVVTTILLAYFDHLMIDLKRPPDDGIKLVAAIGYFHPSYHRSTRTGALKRVGRALKGWTKVMPSETLVPWPFMAVAAVCNQMMSRRKPRMALTTLLATNAYLRPGVASGLKRHNLVPPAATTGRFSHWALRIHILDADEQPSKVGVYDDCIPLDSPDKQWMSPLLGRLCKTLGANQDLMTESMADWSKEWQRSLGSLGLPTAHLYMLRHIGPSDDIASKRRSAKQVVDRGQWVVPSTAKRYEKSALSQAFLNKCQPALVAHMKACERQLPQIMAGHLLPLVYRRV